MTVSSGEPRTLMIYRDEYGCLTVSPPNVHAKPGDELVFYAFGVDAHVDLRPTKQQWNPIDFDVYGQQSGVSVGVPDIPKGVYRYSITSNGDRARGDSDPKIIIPR